MKEIKLTRGFATLVDDEDFNVLNQHKWCAVPSGGETFYAVRKEWNGKGKQRAVWMHRLLINTPVGMFTDHIDGNGLNNQKSNLRICTNSQNQFNKGKSKRNSSGYKGVSWFKPMGKWDVRISAHKRQIHIGYFDSKEEAARAYLEAEKTHHGEFASTI